MSMKLFHNFKALFLKLCFAKIRKKVRQRFADTVDFVQFKI